MAAPARPTSFLIGYALLMFVPFAWTLITSFKTLPDSVQLTIIPDPFTLDGWDYVAQRARPAAAPAVLQQRRSSPSR